MPNCYRVCSVLTLFFLLSGFVRPQVLPKREMRGAWIATVTNLDWPSVARRNPYAVQEQKDELKALLDQLAAAGINAVIFQVRPECDALYNSPYEPWSFWLTGTQGTPPSPLYDPLEFAVEEAHKRGMELHAWFNPYRAERSVDNYALANNHLVKQKPEWILHIGTLKILNPGLQEVRDHVSKVIADVVRRYDVDGVHMDDYFYPYPPNNITTQDTATYSAYPRDIGNIHDWRRDNVNLLIKQIYDSVQAIRPVVKFGMSPFGIWKNGVPAGIFGMDAYSVIYCDAVAWLQGQYIDYITPQLYWQFGGGQDYALLQTWWASQLNGRHFYTGNATYRILQDNWPASEILNQIKFNRAQQNAHGTIQFRTRNITNNNGRIADFLKTDVFRAPSVIPSMAWKEQTPPNPPSNFRWVLPVGSDRFHLQWDPPPPASDGDTAVRYLVYRFTKPSYLPSDLDAGINLIALTGQPSVIPSARVDSVGVQYHYAVSALDRNNNESLLSDVIRFSVPIMPPVLAYPADGEQHFPKGESLKWYRGAPGEEYRFEFASSGDFEPSSLIYTFSTNDTAVAVEGLQPAATYHWRVAAGNQAGTSDYAPARSFRTGWPAPPTLISPVAVVNAPVYPTFRWLRGEGTHFRVRVDTVLWGGGFNVIDTTVTDTFLVSSKYLRPGPTFIWRVTANNAYGSSDWSAEGRFRTSTTSLAEGDGLSPMHFRLYQNYPNPFNPVTTIEFTIAQQNPTVLRVYDLLGRELATLVDETLMPGTYIIRFDARSLPTGVYFYRLVSGDLVESRKMQLIR